MIWEKEVYSEMVAIVGYDTDMQALLITWASGTKGLYANVPEDIAYKLSNAPSVGHMINEEIKPFYSYRRL